MNSLIEVTQTVLFTPARLLGQVEYSASSQGQAPGPLFWIFYLAFTILMLAAWWKIFTKAGQPGWACIIPIYNLYVWCKIVGRPWWWILLMLIPFVNFIIAIILLIDLAKSFGKGVGFGIGLLCYRLFSSRSSASAARNIKDPPPGVLGQRFLDRRNLRN